MAMTSLVMIIVILAILLVIGVPISYSIGIASLFTILQTVPLDISVVTGAQRIFVGMSKFSLTAIPFFILAGNLMNQGGIAKRLVNFVMAILGKLPGALRSADPAVQRADHLLAGSGRHLGCRAVHGRLHPRHHLGAGLYGRCDHHRKEKGL